MIVRPIRYFEDNFCYLIRHLKDKAFTIVDPGDSKLILNMIKENKWNVERVLLTHKHWDHVGDFEKFYAGLSEFINDLHGKETHVPVFAGSIEKIPKVDTPLHKNSKTEEFDFENWTMKTFHSPCHTTGHVLYFLESKTEEEERDLSESNKTDCQFNKMVLTGDTVFVGGTGKFFEGTPAQMAHNVEILMSLPDTTRVFCGHDYFTNNLKFAVGIDKGNSEIYTPYVDYMKKRESKGIHLIPSSVGQEKATNVFFRYKVPSLKVAIGASDDIDSMRILREFKNQGVSL